MKSRPSLFSSFIPLLASLLLTVIVGPALIAAPADQSSTAPSGQTGASSPFTYKMISGYKQPFNDDLQLHFSKGWLPVGGVSVTTWNNDLFFAQLLKKVPTE